MVMRSGAVLWRQADLLGSLCVQVFKNMNAVLASLVVTSVAHYKMKASPRDLQFPQSHNVIPSMTVCFIISSLHQIL